MPISNLLDLRFELAIQLVLETIHGVYFKRYALITIKILNGFELTQRKNQSGYN